MKRLADALVVLAVVGLVWIGIARRGSSGPGHAARPPAPSPAGRAAPAGANSALTPENFAKRFRLGDVENLDCWRAIGALRRDLMEQKGCRARIVAYDGRGHLKMFIPALSVPTDWLESAVRAHLRHALGARQAGLIWADPAARQLLVRHSFDDMLKCGALYTFTRVREENNPAARGSLGEAAFDFEVLFDPGDSGATLYPDSDNSIVKGFTYDRAGMFDFGWNAMARAPAGYFRSEPILGVASRPPPGATVIEDPDRDSIEIRDRRYPGSKEKIEHGVLLEDGGEKADGR